MDTNDFSYVLTKKRIASGLTQTQVANSLYMSRSTYNHYERGFRIPSIETLIELSDLFKTDPFVLIAPLIYGGKDPHYHICTTKNTGEIMELSSHEMSVITNYRLLNNKQRQVVDNLIISLIK